MLRTVLGTNCFGKRMSFNQSAKVAEDFFEEISKSAQVVEFDTATFYSEGNSEVSLSQMNFKSYENVKISTKANPWEGKAYNATGLRMQLETSLKQLQMNCVQIFYLHAPDYKTPIVETLQAVNELYQEKKFKEFGLSNYASWQVAEICMICKSNGWVMPTVYQGMYNSLTRMVEKELFKCLRHFNMRFYAYNPLCGGLLTGKHKFEDANRKREPGRFFGDGRGEIYRNRYWKTTVFEAVEKLKAGLNAVYGKEVDITEASLRWMYNHSKLNKSCGDAIILGCSSYEQYKYNIKCRTKGPLDDQVVMVFDDCWKECCFNCPDYMR